MATFSESAKRKLRSSGIPIEDAALAGLYSVEDARQEVHEEFKPLPALVIPYFNTDGTPIKFMKDGVQTVFVRVRYLGKNRSLSFTKKKPQRYSQLKGSRPYAYFPPLYDWQKIQSNPEQFVIVTEGELKALAACCRDYPAIGLGGVDNHSYRD